MKINYNRWFYDQHKYTQGERDNVTTYNDTKWKNMNQRISTLIDLQSSLIEKEPFGVVGNYAGFDKLVNLLADSNYTFQDLNESLIKTYQMSLKNAMSKMVVNTHAIIASCKNTDKNVVSIDSKYYFVDIPYDQLSYGDRDETIRQNLDKMYSKNKNRFISINEFLSKDILDLLGFAFLCTTNGFINNDWLVALDDKGLHFKIAWERPEDCEFIIYKLDKAFVEIRDIDVSTIRTLTESQDVVIQNKFFNTTTNCIIDIYDVTRNPVTMSAPNFGICSENGLEIKGLQKWTIDQLNLYNTNTARIIIYGIPMLYEVQDVFPAVNYYDMMYTRPVYTDKHEDVYTIDGKLVYGSSTKSSNPMNICTPPISIDKDTGNIFEDVMQCVTLRNELLSYENTFKSIGNSINAESMNHTTFMNKIESPTTKVKRLINEAKIKYDKGAIITSMIPMELNQKFSDFVNRLFEFSRQINIAQTLASAKKYAIDEFYGDNYRMLVNELTKPFTNKALQVFQMIDDNTLQRKYLQTYDCNTRFNRPISEQCFISLKWNTDENCWVFTNPNIKHFKGIQNSFYIDKNDLKGNEVFKFFILYTDTESPSEKNVDIIPFDDEVFDYDKFVNEVNKHIGYVKYWNIENHLQKLSKIYYNSTNSEYQVQVLSEILQKKYNGDEFINEYNSEMNYEPSNITTDNISDYDENTERGPFSINFLFYTLRMMFDNKDKLIAYLMNSLVNDKYANRYSDIDISSVLNNNDYGLPVNFSMFNTAPISIELNNTTFPGNNVNLFYGIPFAVNSSGDTIDSDVYRYTFNRYNNPETMYSLFNDDDTLTLAYRTSYTYPGNEQYQENTCNNDIIFVKMVFDYLDSVYDYINFIDTNYTTTFANYNILNNIKRSIQTKLNSIYDYAESHEFISTDIATIKALLFDNNVLINNLNDIANATDVLVHGLNNNSLQRFFDDSLLLQLRRVYVNSGFDDYAQKRIRALYIHLKKVNSPMNLTAFINWVNAIDKNTIDNLASYVAANENLPINPAIFNLMAQIYDDFFNSFNGLVTTLQNAYNTLHTDVYSNHIDSIVSRCINTLETYNFPLYSISNITFTSGNYNSRPFYAIGNITLDDSHFYPPYSSQTSDTVSILFKVHAENNNGNYTITSITPICDYAFFNGEDITINSVKLYSSSNTEIDSLDITCSFVKVGMSGNSNNDVMEIPSSIDTLVEINNVHEKIIVTNDTVINKKQAAMNYELYAGRYFKPLNYVSEYVLDRATMKSNALDIVNVNNNDLNLFAKEEYAKNDSIKVYFKPTQVRHLTPNEDDVITGVGKGYTIGQHVYVKTTDSNHFIFPIIITAIDHSVQHGIIEAIVDYQNSDWFNIPFDNISEYLNQEIECEIIDDNICNFLDTFSGDYKYYNYPLNIELDSSITHYTLPGDPIFVLSNPDYVYTRVSWMFNKDVQNRFIDEPHKMYDFIYIGNTSVYDSAISINTISHDFNTLTNPELYPVLRTEPNDHYIWKNELLVFESKLTNLDSVLNGLNVALEDAEIAYEEATTADDKMQCKIRLDEISLKIDYYEKFKSRIESYVKQQETPTTWFNVNAYDDAMVYINNGRSRIIGMPVFNIRDIDYTDAIEILLYDWEHKCWLDPSSYTINTVIINEVQLDENVDKLSDNVLHSIEITFNDPSYSSKNVLIYFAYKKSDVFDTIIAETKLLNVIFKPTLVINNNDSNELYTNINVRKHFDTEEYYKFTEPSVVDDFSLENGYYIKRVQRSGKYPYSSLVRFEDVTINDGEYTLSDFDVYFKFPFNNIELNLKETNITYSANIRKQINSYKPNQIITLICIDNNSDVLFDGNLSTIIFTAKTGSDPDNQSITIIDSNVELKPGRYTCTVAKDPMYPMESGVIDVNVIVQQTPLVLDDKHSWYKLANLDNLKIVPNEMIFVPHDNVTETTITIGFKNIYTKDSDEEINPHMYYYDTKNNIRYPISNIMNNDNTTRLEIDTSTFTDVKKIKSNYIGICRVSLQKIPENGLLDFTGLIPTPLSRDRYEFWVNGRYINNTDNLSIISPTSIQLKNLTSLRNFELIELVDDSSESISVFPKGTVYTDLDGNYYPSYKLALLSNSKIRYQNLNYKFYVSNRNNLDTYTGSIIKRPNNFNIEPDILDLITDPSAVISSYEELYNIPTINGVPLKHPFTADLGISEIPSYKLLNKYDEVWKKEITTLKEFPITHNDLTISNSYVSFKIDKLENGDYRVFVTGICDEYFSVYISTNEEAAINNTSVVEIIPMISVGTAIIIDSSFEGNYIHSTFINSKTIQL